LTEVLKLNYDYYYFNSLKNELFWVSANIVINRSRNLKYMLIFYVWDWDLISIYNKIRFTSFWFQINPFFIALFIPAVDFFISSWNYYKNKLINKKCKNPEFELNVYIGLLLFSLSACLLNVLNV